MDERTRAVANQWMDWASSFQACLRPVFWGLVRTPAEKRDAAAIEDGRKKCAEMMGILDAALAERHYVAGPFSMGDIPIGCHVQVWMRLPIERPRQPNLAAWFERLCARLPYKKLVDLPLS